MELCGSVRNTRTVRSFDKLEERISKVHGSKYDYTKAIFKGMQTKMCITCPTHGDFWQTPSKHLNTFQGCSECGKGVNSAKSKSNLQEFLLKANLVHGVNYTYNKFTYTSAKTKGIITCITHGDFLQSPNNHLRGKKCPQCALIQRRGVRRNTLEVFSAKAAKIHNNLYTYDEGVYRGNQVKFKIFCTQHEDYFLQAPSNHLAGNGCPTCATCGFNPRKPAIVYYIKVNNGQAYKIGITNRTVAKRFTPSDLENIEVLKTYYFELGSDAYQVEQAILKHKTYLGYEGNPLLSSGNTELFSVDIADLVELNNKCKTN
jgi:hypothetical protein